MPLDAACSPAQAELFADSTACQWSAPLLQTSLGEITVFEVLDVIFDEFASVMTLRAARAAGQFIEPPLGFRIQTDG